MHCFVALTKCVANDKLFCKSFLLAYFLFICIDWHGMCKEIFSNVKSAMLVTCLCINLSFLSDDINTTARLRLKNVKCFIITNKTMFTKSKIVLIYFITCSITLYHRLRTFIRIIMINVYIKSLKAHRFYI